MGFAYWTKKVAFRQYVEKAGGGDEDEQCQVHERRFASQEFQVLQASGIDVGGLVVVRQRDCVRVYQLFIVPEYQSGASGRRGLTSPDKVKILKATGLSDGYGGADALDMQLTIKAARTRGCLIVN